MKIAQEKLLIPKKKRTCKCKINGEFWSNATDDIKFCPKCGKHLFHDISEPIDCLKLNEEELDGAKLHYGNREYDIVVSYKYDEPETIFVALCNNFADEDSALVEVNLPLLEQAKQQMKLDLGDLWNEEDFGFWTALSIL
jgi:hypothetical protein